MAGTGRRAARLGTGVAALVVALTAPASGLGAGARPAVSAAVQVTRDANPTRAHSSPQIARNPTNGELVVVETDVHGSFGVDVHISSDEGRSWFRAGNPMLAPFTWNSDYAINGPYFTVAFDDGGTLFLAFSATDPKYAGLNRSERPRPVFLARSADGGRTFATTTAYPVREGDPTTVNNRRAMVALDPESSATVYLSWLQSPPSAKPRAMIARSSDGGRTFLAPVDLAEAEAQGGYQPRVAVGRDHVVHAIYPAGGYVGLAPQGGVAPEAPVRPLFFRRSVDGGRTWSAPRVIDQGNAGFAHGRKHLLAADRRSGNLYAVWYGNEKLRPNLQDDTEIFVRVSRDGGRTWGDRVTVNDDARSPTIMHYDPGISIAPNGRVDVAWYDFRNSPTPEAQAETPPFNHGGFQDVYYASSTDGGGSFGPNVRITDRLIDRRIGVWSNNVHSHHNVGLTSTDAAVYFAWQDTRNGDALTNSEDVYFASLVAEPADPADEGWASDVPTWVLVGASMATGMGLAMVLVVLAARRARRARARARATARRG